MYIFFFFQAEDGIRDIGVTGVQTCALPIYIQDADGLHGLLKRVKPLYTWLRAVFADSIYNRLTAMLACFLFGLTLIIVRRLAGSTGFVVQPRRWVVERSLGWLGRWRRLSKIGR